MKIVGAVERGAYQIGDILSGLLVGDTENCHTCLATRVGNITTTRRTNTPPDRHATHHIGTPDIQNDRPGR